MKDWRHLSPQDVQREYFPSRSVRWIKDQAKAGAFGAASFDPGGWLIPAAGCEAYLERHRATVGDDIPMPRFYEASNLVQSRQ